MLKQKLTLLVFRLLRSFLPVVRFGKNYFVFRHRDVTEILDRDTDFTISQINAPNIDKYTGPFILGMDRSPQETRESEILQKAVKRDDMAWIEKIVSQAASDLVDKARPSGSIDMVSELSLVIPWHFLDQYCGTPGPDMPTMQHWMRSIFYNVFLNFSNNEEQIKEAEKVAAELHQYLDQLILEKQEAIKKGTYDGDDLLARLIRMQDNPATHLDNDGIRRNISGVILGAVDTISKSAVNIMSQLLMRPHALRGAQEAAKNNDFVLLSNYAFEAMRFNPFNPVLLRHVEHDTKLSSGKRFKKGKTVWSVVWSAMFDPNAFSNPGSFRTDRSYKNYILFGWGMHRCFGEYVNKLELPIICRELLKLPNLRIAPGKEGKIIYDSTGAFPDRFVLKFDPETP